jgi:tetratricopeptide (TPR) repeat protein
MSNRKTISLCMIAKNEARFIEECLESFRDAVDEIILVDTGSTDATMEIAERAGAKIFHFDWCDDFAAARNESIKHAQSDWVLWMDADERLAPGGAQVLREAVARDNFDFGYMPMHDALSLSFVAEEVVSGRARRGEPYLLPRLLRRLPDLRFEGVVHENVNCWISTHPRVEVLETAAIHLGYVPELRQARDKDRRNLKLLQKRVEIEPNNATVHGFLAQEYLILGDVDEARLAAENGWRVAEANPDAFSYSLRLALVRAQLQLKDGLVEAALNTVVRAEQRVGAHPDLNLFGGIVLMRLALQSKDPQDRRDRLDGAGEAFQSALDLGDQVFPERCMGRSANVIGLVGLGTVGILRGRTENALYCFDQALETEPTNPEIQLARAEALVLLGRPAEALNIVEPLLRDAPDAWLVGARAAEELGDIDTFEVLLGRATDLAQRQDYVDLHRKELQSLLQARLSAYRGDPKPGPGAVGAACALMVGIRPDRRAIEMDDYDQAEVSLLFRNLVRLGKGALLGRLGKAKAERMLPGVQALARNIAPDLLIGSPQHHASKAEPALVR